MSNSESESTQLIFEETKRLSIFCAQILNIIIGQVYNLASRLRNNTLGKAKINLID